MSAASKNELKGRAPGKDAAARREQILCKATELFAEHGFSDAMTQELADRLGVGKGTIYRYFPSKRELFLAAADRVMRALSAQVEANVAGLEDGLERIARGILAFLTFFAEHPEYVELLIQERAQFKDRTRPTYIEHRQEHGQQWRKLYGTLTEEGRLRAIPPEQISDVIGNLIYGTMFTNYFAGAAKPVAEQARDILDVVFRGILSDVERERLKDADLSAGGTGPGRRNEAERGFRGGADE
ncbi:TetR/AcrR family transcriptional regulator [Planctomyces sp. SH-PL62]|uniref:TetR/AcrR family transcriptional regulator n=1 Tax=Planctomyces sp. SH-PL62 TaxID=1636152 RepID=UPI00078D6DDE|nr:TetR/AcrR family transcriptional regulator [Planctomyces sp. SH-PL62]AMV36608.1 HTH-type transcriptional repressor AcnR [Planctomyces sp. SH-PL62]